MIAVPFIYFTFLLIAIWWKNKRFDISAYLVLMYAITSFFAVIIDALDLYTEGAPKTEITLLPTITYCFFISLTIYPFYLFKSSKIKTIEIIKNTKLFDFTVYLFFVVFVLMIVFFGQDIIYRITHGDWLQLREQVRSGELTTGIAGGGRFMSLIQVLLSVFSAASPVMLMFYFYSLCFLKRSKLFNLLILLGSFSFIIQGIIGIDRSRVVYYILIFGAMFVLFKPFLNKQHLRSVYRAIIIFGSLILLYFIAVTIARFGYRESGTLGGIILYAGQPFLNFVYFYENLNIAEPSYHRVFPLFYRLFLDTEELGMFEYAGTVRYYYGVRILVFSSFVGDLSAYIGKNGAYVFCVIFYILSRITLRRKQLSTVSLGKLMHLYVLVLIPLLGIIVYYYGSYTRVLSAIFIIIVSLGIKYKIRF